MAAKAGSKSGFSIPLVNQDVRLRATFLGWWCGLFFAGFRIVFFVPLASGHRPVKSECHHEDEALKPVSVVYLSVVDAEAA